MALVAATPWNDVAKAAKATGAKRAAWPDEVTVPAKKKAEAARSKVEAARSKPEPAKPGGTFKRRLMSTPKIGAAMVKRHAGGARLFVWLVLLLAAAAAGAAIYKYGVPSAVAKLL